MFLVVSVLFDRKISNLGKTKASLATRWSSCSSRSTISLWVAVNCQVPPLAIWRCLMNLRREEVWLSTRYGYGTYQNTGVYSFLSSILISTKYIITQLAAMVKIQMWCFLPKEKCHWQGDRWVLASEARWTRQSHKSTWKKVASGGLRCIWAVGFHGIFIQQWITGVSRDLNRF